MSDYGLNTEQRIGVTEVESLIFHATASLQAQIAGMQEEINFLHEKYNDIYDRRLSSRIAKLWNRIFKGGV